MSRPLIFLCAGCNRSRRNQPAELICPRCGSDMRKVRAVYERAIRDYPALKSATIPEFVERLYAALKRRNGRT